MGHQSERAIVGSGVFRMCESRGPRGSGGRKSPSGVQGQSPGRGSGGRSPPEANAFFVTECLHFDVLEEKSVKQPKIPSQKIMVG